MAKVLVVEDEPMQLDHRLQMLEGDGHKVVGVRTYQEAIDALPLPELVVTDWCLDDDFPSSDTVSNLVGNMVCLDNVRLYNQVY